MVKKIAIICGSPGSMMMAPFDNPEYEIWVLGNRIDAFKGKRITKIFEIHDDLSQHGDNNGEDYQNLLAGMKIPLVVGEGFPLTNKGPYPSHIQTFPFYDVRELYGSHYLTSSSAYMMALAILEGAEEIEIYGVDMAVDDFEYFWQRPCMEAWIGFAKGRGIKVKIPEISPLGRSEYIEGANSGGAPNFEKEPFTQKEFLAVAERQKKQIADKQAQISILNSEIMAHSGAQQVYERLAKVARAVEAGQSIKTLTSTIRIKGE